MGDLNKPSNKSISESSPNVPSDTPKPSIDILNEAKPSATFAMDESREKGETAPTLNMQTTLEALTIVDPVEEKPEANPPQPTEKLKSDNKVADSEHKVEESVVQENEKVEIKCEKQSFGPKETQNETSAILSDGGAPLKTILKTTSESSSTNETMNSSVFQQSQVKNSLKETEVNSNAEIKPKPSKEKDGETPAKTIHRTTSGNSSSIETINSGVFEQNQAKNPLKETEVSSNEELKTKTSKKKDGNPVLGVGYKKDEGSKTPSHRIPPGGYSKGLW